MMNLTRILQGLNQYIPPRPLLLKHTALFSIGLGGSFVVKDHLHPWKSFLIKCLLASAVSYGGVKAFRWKTQAAKYLKIDPLLAANVTLVSGIVLGSRFSQPRPTSSNTSNDKEVVTTQNLFNNPSWHKTPLKKGTVLDFSDYHIASDINPTYQTLQAFLKKTVQNMPSRVTTLILKLQDEPPFSLEFLKNTSITSLIIEEGQMPTGIETLTQLTSLEIHAPSFDRTNTLQPLVNLEHLSLKKTGIKDLNFIHNLPKLTSLDLSGLSLPSLNNLKENKTLKQLNLSYLQGLDQKKIKTNLQVLQSLLQLEALDITGWDITDLNWLPSLSQLKRFAFQIQVQQNILENYKASLPETLEVTFIGTGSYAKCNLLLSHKNLKTAVLKKIPEKTFEHTTLSLSCSIETLKIIGESKDIIISELPDLFNLKTLVFSEITNSYRDKVHLNRFKKTVQKIQFLDEASFQSLMPFLYLSTWESLEEVTVSLASDGSSINLFNFSNLMLAPSLRKLNILVNDGITGLSPQVTEILQTRPGLLISIHGMHLDSSFVKDLSRQSCISTTWHENELGPLVIQKSSSLSIPTLEDEGVILNKDGLSQLLENNDLTHEKKIKNLSQVTTLSLLEVDERVLQKYLPYIQYMPHLKEVLINLTGKHSKDTNYELNLLNKSKITKFKVMGKLNLEFLEKHPTIHSVTHYNRNFYKDDLSFLKSLPNLEELETPNLSVKDLAYFDGLNLKKLKIKIDSDKNVLENFKGTLPEHCEITILHTKLKANQELINHPNVKKIYLLKGGYYDYLKIEDLKGYVETINNNDKFNLLLLNQIQQIRIPIKKASLSKDDDLGNLLAHFANPQYDKVKMILLIFASDFDITSDCTMSTEPLKAFEEGDRLKLEYSSYIHKNTKNWLDSKSNQYPDNQYQKFLKYHF